MLTNLLTLLWNLIQVCNTSRDSIDFYTRLRYTENALINVMMHSIEGRAPFLQPSVASTAMRLDPSSRYDGRTRKIALRNLAKRHLPRTISDRRKQGFVLPMSRWLSEWFNLHGDADTYFNAHDIQGVDMNVLARLVTEDLQHGVRRERFLFAVVMLAEWVKLYRARVSEYRRQIPDNIKQVWR